MKVIKKCNMRVIGKIMVFILAFQFVGMMCQNKILAEDTFRLTQYVQNFIIEVSDNEDFACWKECEVALEQNDVVRSKNGVIINRYTVYNENGIYGTVLCSENGEVAYYSLNDAVDELWILCCFDIENRIRRRESKNFICWRWKNNFGRNSSFASSCAMYTRSG